MGEKTCESCKHYLHVEISMHKSCGHASNLRFTSRKNDSMPEIIQKPEEKNPGNECIFYLPKTVEEKGLSESVIDTMIEIFVSFTSFPFMFVGIIVGIAHNGASVGYNFGEALWKLYMKKKGVKDER